MLQNTVNFTKSCEGTWKTASKCNPRHEQFGAADKQHTFLSEITEVCSSHREGERLYAHVSAAMSQILAAEEELSDSTGLSHGSVSIRSQ